MLPNSYFSSQKDTDSRVKICGTKRCGTCSYLKQEKELTFSATIHLSLSSSISLMNANSEPLLLSIQSFIRLECQIPEELSFPFCALNLICSQLQFSLVTRCKVYFASSVCSRTAFTLSQANFEQRYEKWSKKMIYKQFQCTLCLNDILKCPSKASNYI